MKFYDVFEPEVGNDLLAALRRPKNEGVMRAAAYEAANEIERLRAALQKISDLVKREPANPFLADKMDRIATAALTN